VEVGMEDLKTLYFRMRDFGR